MLQGALTTHLPYSVGATLWDAGVGGAFPKVIPSITSCVPLVYRCRLVVVRS